MLSGYLPEWFECHEIEPGHIIGRAHVSATIWRDEGIALRVTREKRPSVSEEVPGTALPKHCPERHLFLDSTFCMALTAMSVTNDHDAVAWWDSLAQYLICQSAAHETGFWPLHNGLDHGAAGVFHARAIRLSEKLGVLDEYFAVYSRQLADFSQETKQRLRQSVLFRQLLRQEQLRVFAMDQYRFEAQMSQTECCGTMHDCCHTRPQTPMYTPLPALFGLRPRLLSSSTQLSGTSAASTNSLAYEAGRSAR